MSETKITPRFKTKYAEVVVPALQEEFNERQSAREREAAARKAEREAAKASRRSRPKE